LTSVDLGPEHKSLCACARLPPQSSLQPVQSLVPEPCPNHAWSTTCRGHVACTLTRSAVTSSCRTQCLFSGDCLCVNILPVLDLSKLPYLHPAHISPNVHRQPLAKHPVYCFRFRPHYPRFINRPLRSASCIYSAPRLPTLTLPSRLASTRVHCLRLHDPHDRLRHPTRCATCLLSLQYPLHFTI
jgi:hypothetical protein